MKQRVSIILMASLLLYCQSLIARCQAGPHNNAEVIRKSVVFLHIKDAKGNLKEVGTGFLLQVPLKSQPQKAYWLLATARHMVDPIWAGCSGADPNQVVYAVLNTKTYDPTTDLTGIIEIPIVTGNGESSWKFSSDNSVDVAVSILDGEVFSKLAVENSPLGISQLPTKQELDQVDTGDDIISAGLLLGVSGTKRNYPIFKFGRVSSKPQEKISMTCCPDCPAVPQTEWMIAASLVPGNSGSPIVYMPDVFSNGRRPFLLGVQSSALIGDDVAGMAPVSFLIDAIERLNLEDANLSPFMPSTPQITPTGAQPNTLAVPGPTKSK